MTPPPLPSVPPFRDGLYLGVNAVPDVALVVDCPEGCYFQAERVALNHDLTSTLLDPLGRHRLVQTEVDYGRLPLGTEPHLEATLDRAVARLSPALVLVAQATMVELTGNDLDALAARAEARLGVPVRAVHGDSLRGDFLDGWDAFVRLLAEVLTPDRITAPEAVGLVGYLPDRLEEDHRANLRELTRLVEGLGVPCAGALCDGGDTRSLACVLGAGTLVGLPHGRGLAERVARRTGARVVELPLPLGLDGTVRWLTTLGEALGRPEAARALVEAELAALVPPLDHLRTTRLAGRSVAIAHDPHWATGLAEACLELGLSVPVLGLQRRRGPAFQPSAAWFEPPVVLDALDVPAFRAAIAQAAPGGRVDVVLGPQELRGVADDLGAAFLEVGYPSFTTHAFSPRPLVGFAGLRRLVDELVNALAVRTWRETAACRST
jgi:nitrogenase molybdenum-iron protein alpha/beta subunit